MLNEYNNIIYVIKLIKAQFADYNRQHSGMTWAVELDLQVSRCTGRNLINRLRTSKRAGYIYLRI